MNDAPTELPLAVVLVRPREEGNVGATARAMANMGLSRLLLVEPAVTIGNAGRARAVNAGHILDSIERFDSLAEAVAPMRRVIGTTSGRDRRQAVPPLTARELAEELRAEGWDLPTALVFGPERSGLSTDELAQCNPQVTIPCAAVQPTLNLAQAVLLVAYELNMARQETAGSLDGEPPAPAGAVDGLFGQAEEILSEVGFARDDTFATVMRDLRRLAARGRLTEREVTILRGACRRTAYALRHFRGD